MSTKFLLFYPYRIIDGICNRLNLLLNRLFVKIKWIGVHAGGLVKQSGGVGMAQTSIEHLDLE